MSFKLLSYNIRFGGRGREARLAEVIRSVAPDMVVFQEAIHPTVIEGLAHATGLTHWAARPAHSIGYISRIEVAHHEWHRPVGAKHAFLEIVLAGSEARIFGRTTSSSSNTTSRSHSSYQVRSTTSCTSRVRRVRSTTRSCRSRR